MSLILSFLLSNTDSKLHNQLFGYFRHPVSVIFPSKMRGSVTQVKNLVVAQIKRARAGSHVLGVGGTRLIWKLWHPKCGDTDF